MKGPRVLLFVSSYDDDGGGAAAVAAAEGDHGDNNGRLGS